ncbi:MAG: GNAT family N-acetyltransferase [Xenococcaceae cyanobacterium]
MIRFQEIKQNEVPWDLLLLAQPSLENIQTDLKQGLCHVAKIDSEIVGVFVIVQKSERLWEITNIAVAPKYQGQKIGKAILAHAISVAQNLGAREIEIGTGNSSLNQLAFYQKAGFRIVGVIPDFFTENYNEPIYENGIQCRDSIRLKYRLTSE